MIKHNNKNNTMNAQIYHADLFWSLNMLSDEWASAANGSDIILNTRNKSGLPKYSRIFLFII